MSYSEDFSQRPPPEDADRLWIDELDAPTHRLLIEYIGGPKSGSFELLEGEALEELLAICDSNDEGFYLPSPRTYSTAETDAENAAISYLGISDVSDYQQIVWSIHALRATRASDVGHGRR